MKRFLAVLCTVLLCLGLLGGGFLTVRKVFSMYKNIWDVLDRLTISSDNLSSNLDSISGRVDSLGEEVHTLVTQADHLHRQAFPGEQTGFDYSWVDRTPPYIAHACGGINGLTYTNSREAFVYNYELGQRVFEIDFNLTNDGVLIASHDENIWRNLTGSELDYTLENFNQQPIHGSYESLTCAEVIELMAAYPDAYVVTDTKATTQSEVLLAFSQLVHCAKQTHPEVLERIIPQIYNEDMLSWISAVHPFRSVIFTLYQLRWTPEAILNFCMNSGVRFITMPADQVNDDVLKLWDTLGIHIAVHTINDPSEAEMLFDKGVDMIYTDFLTLN